MGSLLKASIERFVSDFIRKSRYKHTICKLSAQLFELADVILPRIDGPHFTFVDPRKHDDMIPMIRNAQRLIALFEEKSVPRNKVIVSVS